LHQHFWGNLIQHLHARQLRTTEEDAAGGDPAAVQAPLPGMIPLLEVTLRTCGPRSGRGRLTLRHEGHGPGPGPQVDGLDQGPMTAPGIIRQTPLGRTALLGVPSLTSHKIALAMKSADRRGSM
jgi:hypothetical protein